MVFVILDRRNILIGLGILAVVFSLGVIIGHFSNARSEEYGKLSRQAKQLDKIMTDQFANEKDMVEEALENVDTENLRNYLETLTKEPHIAGHKRDNELINYIRQNWIDNGLDRVELAEYDLYLSWPNQESQSFLEKIIY